MYDTSSSQGELDAKEETSLQILDRLCKVIYSKDNTDRLRTHAILFHIYHHAIHDNWYEARDLMLMSHLQVRFASSTFYRHKITLIFCLRRSPDHGTVNVVVVVVVVVMTTFTFDFFSR